VLSERRPRAARDSQDLFMGPALSALFFPDYPSVEAPKRLIYIQPWRYTSRHISIPLCKEAVPVTLVSAVQPPPIRAAPGGSEAYIRIYIYIYIYTYFSIDLL